MPTLSSGNVPPSVAGVDRDLDMSAHPAAIEARHLDFYYGEHQVLFDVSLTVPERSVTALIGPSGCGKSTFLRTMNRMNDLIEGSRCQGEILVEGQNIMDPAVDVVLLRKHVGMVFQKSTPFPKSIFDNVAYGPRVAGEPSGTGRLSRILPPEGGALGRSEGSPDDFRHVALRRSATAIVHCQNTGNGS